MATNTGRRWLIGALAGLVVLASLEGVARITILLANGLLDEPIRTRREILREQTERIARLLRPDPSRLLAIDSSLGWRYRAGHHDTLNTTNAQGLRADHDYRRRPPDGVLRIAAFGNSFVYGNEVTNREAWPEQLEAIAPTVEVLNYGVGGYGIDQAYLRFREEGLALAPTWVVIGFSPDDLSRVVSVYRRFRSSLEIPIAKPRFRLDARGALQLIPNPLPDSAAYAKYLVHPEAIIELGHNDQWYHSAIYENPAYDLSAVVRLVVGAAIRVDNRYFDPNRLIRGDMFNPGSSAFQIQLAIFRRFAAESRAAGARPFALLLPDRTALALVRHGRPSVFAPLATELRAAQIEVLDLTRAFLAADAAGDDRRWFMPGGHYSPLGNRLVASWLRREIPRHLGAASATAAERAPRRS
jgi:hypothetical protein